MDRTDDRRGATIQLAQEREAVTRSAVGVVFSKADVRDRTAPGTKKTLRLNRSSYVALISQVRPIASAETPPQQDESHLFKSTHYNAPASKLYSVPLRFRVSD